MRLNRVKFITELAKQDMTLVKLSTLTGISRVTLSNIKCGKSCKDEHAKSIAKALNCKVEDLI
ncbi:MAG: helix-turn-helix transcriptional regulator [Erysipelotrichaceae bacterium]|nr:helix-turn-helix transcriptional regulator [Erysipelotrichaceae bacterium]